MQFIKAGLLAICLAVIGPVMSTADAAVIWQVQGIFSDGTTLSGTFDTDVYGYVQSANLFTESQGAFTGFNYTMADSYSSSGFTFVDFQPGYTSDLHLQFANDLTVPSGKNPIIDAVSYECQGSYSCYIPSGGSTRYLTGGGADFASVAISAVPEPETWALFIVGFGILGFALRQKRRFEVAIAPV